MKNCILMIFFGSLLMVSQLNGQTNASSDVDNAAVGLGFGLDYGGMGVNISAYPMKDFGVFIGVGYALAGVGVNGGAKLRFAVNRPSPKVTPYLIAMYGYNAAIVVTNQASLNKLFYGFSAGAGIDIRPRKHPAGYWSLGVIVPFRSSKVDAYFDDLKYNHGVEFQNELFPVAFSIGYKFKIK